MKGRKGGAMNRYGRRALKHWESFRQEEYAQIQDPISFFSKMGERIEEQIAEMSDLLAGNDPPGETYLAKLGRLNMARLQAEERVMREMLQDPGSEQQVE